MVRMRLKRWTQASDGPDAWRGIFTNSINELWPLSQADPPSWSESCRPVRQRQAVARDLSASIIRFMRAGSAI